MVNVSKGLTFKTTILHLGVIPEVILNLFCVVFGNKDSDTDLFAIAFIWPKERCESRSVICTHTHTHVPNTHLLALHHTQNYSLLLTSYGALGLLT